MQLFFLSRRDGQRVWLDEEEARHATTVLRKKPGDELWLMDGVGHRIRARIEVVGKKEVELLVLNEELVPERKTRFHLAVAPTKNMDRIEWMLEKCVEIGLEEISFIRCSRSERTVLKTDRLEKIIRSAGKQSLKYHQTRLNGLMDLPDFIRQHKSGNHRFIATCENQQVYWKAAQAPEALVLIGPEGDFTPAEVEMTLEVGFQSLSLGEARLRTETAAVQACSWWSYINP